MTRLLTKIYHWTKLKAEKSCYGDDCSQEEIIGTAYLAAAYLEEVGFDKSKLVYVVGSTGITQELDDVGINYLPIGVRHHFECDAGPQGQFKIFERWLPAYLLGQI